MNNTYTLFSERATVIKKVLILLLVTVINGGCDDFIVIDGPRNEIIREKVYANDETAIAAMRGIYSEIMANNASGFAGGSSGISLLTGLSSDEMMAVSTDSDFYTNSLSATNNTVKGALWDPAYKYIYYCNSMIEGLNLSDALSIEIRNQLEGESRFLRAFCYFYLVNLFGDVPLVVSTDYRVTSKVSRSKEADVYQQILMDLQKAIDLLVDGYSFSNEQRIRPNRWAAIALLARTYLYMGDWDNAEAMSSQLMNSSLYALEAEPDNVFQANSSEAILQFMPVVPGYNTWEGNRFIPVFLGNPPTFAVNADLINAFETDDARFRDWLGNFTIGTDTYYYPFKYKVNASAVVTEYFMVLRLAEQYLIRAEARAQQGNLGEAILDLDVIRKRGGLLGIQETNPAIGKDELLIVIQRERQVEFFAEWGHRWFDLKRTGRVNQVMQAAKDGIWQPTDVLYPIPQTEMDRNTNLNQNSGY
jgi:tetratricopeptide (TPR) repeat protein